MFYSSVYSVCYLTNSSVIEVNKNEFLAALFGMRILSGLTIGFVVLLFVTELDNKYNWIEKTKNKFIKNFISKKLLSKENNKTIIFYSLILGWQLIIQISILLLISEII